MSRFTHTICDDCWDMKDPDHPSPREGSGDLERCCWCGTATRSGIYLREDPDLLACKGQHERPGIDQDGFEWFETPHGAEAQCARCGSSTGEISDHVSGCISSPEWCEANPLPGREQQKRASCFIPDSQ